MNGLIRTTITIPAELFQRLKTSAFYQNKTISGLVREGISKVVDYKNTTSDSGLSSLVGKYSLKGKKAEFTRKSFYDQLIRKKMPR